MPQPGCGIHVFGIHFGSSENKCRVSENICSNWASLGFDRKLQGSVQFVIQVQINFVFANGPEAAIG